MRGKRLIVVEDEAPLRELYARALEQAGYQVRTAGGAAACRRLLREEPADCLLLDIGLPDLDGYRVARRIRELDPERRTTIVALTGWGQPEDRRRAREAGIAHHLVKPAELGMLRELLAAIAAAKPS